LTVETTQAASDGGPQGRSAMARESIVPSGNLYIPSLDGIRAISFMLVFVAHAGLGNIIPGGFGVNVFFLLSGYLITTLLRMEYGRSGGISLGGFYLRRVLRILPPLYLTLLLALVVTVAAMGWQAVPLAGTVAQALQVANYYEIYATQPQSMHGTNVLWSLAVEEHFYLVFPLLYLWMSPRFSVRQQAIVLLGLCAAALAWRCVLRFHFDAEVIRTYYATDTRFDCILFGCAMAVIANPVFRDPLHEWLLAQMKWLLPVSLAGLCGTFLVRSDDFRETLRYTLQGLTLIPLFIAAIHYQKSWPVKFLNLPFVRFVGVLSYTLYLCHAIIMEAVHKTGITNPFVSAFLSFGLAFLFATAVHYWVERPCARLRKRLSNPH
jgi:peptidoglycan/LPS O-acetylase OafA/YrhL